MIITEGQLKEIHLQSYQCVVVYLDSEFNWTKKTEDVFKQAQSRFFSRTIRSLGGKTSENRFQTTYLLGIPNLTNASAVKPRYICFPYLLLNEKKLYKRGLGDSVEISNKRNLQAPSKTPAQIALSAAPKQLTQLKLRLYVCYPTRLRNAKMFLNQTEQKTAKKYLLRFGKKKIK